jgi:hypothetical protein
MTSQLYGLVFCGGVFRRLLQISPGYDLRKRTNPRDCPWLWMHWNTVLSPQVTSYSSVAHRLDCDQAVSNSYCNVLGAHAKIQNVGNSSSLQIRQRFMRFLGRFLAHNAMPSQNGLIQTFLI